MKSDLTAASSAKDFIIINVLIFLLTECRTRGDMLKLWQKRIRWSLMTLSQAHYKDNMKYNFFNQWYCFSCGL